MKKFLIPFLAGIALILLIAAQPKIGTRGVMLEQDGIGTNTTIVTGKSIAATNVIPLNATVNRLALIGSDGIITNGVNGTGALTNNGSGTLGYYDLANLAPATGGKYIATNAGTGWDTTIRSVSTNTVPLKIETEPGLNLTNFFQIATNGGVPFFVVASNKFVGIGTNAPLAPIHVVPVVQEADFFRLDHTNGTSVIRMGVFPSAPTFGAIWLGNVARTGAGLCLACDSTGFLIINGPSTINFQTAGAARWSINSPGNLLPGADNTYNLGASTTRIKTIEVAETISSKATNAPSLVTTNNKANGTIFTSLVNSGVTNSTTETTLIGTGQGTLTLPANFLIPGRTIRITVSGIFSDDAVTPGTVTIAAKLGATTVATTGAQTPTAGISAGGWKGEIIITCRSTGASGTIFAHGSFENQGSALAENNWWMVNTGTSTIDTTATQAVDVTWDWGTADADNSTTGQIAIVEVLR